MGAAKTEEKPKGTCPMAAKMGFETVEAYNRTDRKVCKSLKQTCCKAESLNNYQKNFKAWVKESSKTLWTLSKLPTIMGNIMGNLKVDKCGGDDKKDAKKDEKKDEKKDDKKDEKKDDKKEEKKDEKKADAAKKRILQALNASAGVSGGAKVKVAAPKVKAGVKVGGTAKVAAPKVKAGVKVGGAAKAKVAAPEVKAGIKLGGGAKAKVAAPKVKIGVKGGLKAKANVKGGLKMGAKTSHKLNVNVHLKAKAAGYKKPKGYDNAVAPKDFLKGQKCRTQFEAAYAMLYGVNHARKAVAKTAFGCFKAIAQLRGELSCAVCDNSLADKFKNPNVLPIKPEGFKDLGVCINMIRYFHHYQDFLVKMLDFAAAMGKDVTAIKAKLDLKDDTKDCENKADPKPEPKKDDKKDDKHNNDFLPPLKDDKKKRILQAKVEKKDEKKDDKKTDKKDQTKIVDGFLPGL